MYTPFKMKGKSPMMKKLIGNQHRLPAELKAKIKAAPESPGKMKKESMAKLKKSAAKLKKGKVNPFSAEYKRMTNKQRERKYGADYKDRIQGSGKKAITRENIGKALNKTKNKINKLNENIQAGADKISKDLKKKKTIKIADKLKLPKQNSSKKNNNKKGPIDWDSAPAVGTKKRTQWYKDNNLALDDTTPALMKKSAAKMKKSATKMKKSPAKLIKRKTDREKLNKLVEKRTKLNKKKDERETKGKKTKRVTRRIKKVQNKINKNPKAQEDLKKNRKKKNVEQMVTDHAEKMMDFLMKEPVRKMKRERGEPKKDHLRPQKRRTSKR